MSQHKLSISPLTSKNKEIGFAIPGVKELDKLISKKEKSGIYQGDHRKRK